jgi:pepsin A
MNTKRVTNIAAADKARAQAMKQAGHIIKRYGSSSFSINNSVVAYTAQVGVGSPATECKMTTRYFQIVISDETILRHTPY